MTNILYICLKKIPCDRNHYLSCRISPGVRSPIQTLMEKTELNKLAEPLIGRTKLLRFWINGDYNEDCFEIYINPNGLRSWNSILEYLTNIMNPKFGAVRKVICYRSKEYVTCFDDFDTNEKYIVLGFDGRLKNVPHNYMSPSEFDIYWFKKNPRQKFYSREIQSKSTEDFLLKTMKWRRTVVYLLVNGLANQTPTKIVLCPDDMESWNETLRFLSKMLDLPEGIQYLCTIFGDPVVDPHELQHGYAYVAVPFTQKFSPMDYATLIEKLRGSCILQIHPSTTNIGMSKYRKLTLPVGKFPWRKKLKRRSTRASSESRSSKSVPHFQNENDCQALCNVRVNIRPNESIVKTIERVYSSQQNIDITEGTGAVDSGAKKEKTKPSSNKDCKSCIMIPVCQYYLEQNPEKAYSCCSQQVINARQPPELAKKNSISPKIAFRKEVEASHAKEIPGTIKFPKLRDTMELAQYPNTSNSESVVKYMNNKKSYPNIDYRGLDAVYRPEEKGEETFSTSKPNTKSKILKYKRSSRRSSTGSNSVYATDVDANSSRRKISLSGNIKSTDKSNHLTEERNREDTLDRNVLFSKDAHYIPSSKDIEATKSKILSFGNRTESHNERDFTNSGSVVENIASHTPTETSADEEVFSDSIKDVSTEDNEDTFVPSLSQSKTSLGGTDVRKSNRSISCDKSLTEQAVQSISVNTSAPDYIYQKTQTEEVSLLPKNGISKDACENAVPGVSNDESSIPKFKSTDQSSRASATDSLEKFSIKSDLDKETVTDSPEKSYVDKACRTGATREANVNTVKPSSSVKNEATLDTTKDKTVQTISPRDSVNVKMQTTSQTDDKIVDIAKSIIEADRNTTVSLDKQDVSVIDTAGLALLENETMDGSENTNEIEQKNDYPISTVPRESVSSKEDKRLEGEPKKPTERNSFLPYCLQKIEVINRMDIKVVSGSSSEHVFTVTCNKCFKRNGSSSTLSSAICSEIEKQNIDTVPSNSKANVDGTNNLYDISTKISSDSIDNDKHDL